MIDHLMTFASEAAAKADPVVGSYFANGEWRSDICVAGVFVWAPASNSIGTDPNGTPYVVRQSYDTNWRDHREGRTGSHALVASVMPFGD